MHKPTVSLLVSLLLVAPAWAQQSPSSTDAMQAVDTTAPATTQDKLADAKPVTGEHAMVVSAQHLATNIGRDILEKGGNAVDAAVAIGYAEAVVHPCCGNLGGGGFMTVHLADGRNLFLNFREKAPHKASADMFQDDDGNVIDGLSTDSYLATGVPGTVMGLNAALEKYGTMDRDKVMAPAIKLARQGYKLRQGDVDILHESTDDFAQHPHAASIFLDDGEAWQAGDTLVQKDLADTLEAIAENGNKAFYKGDIAKTIVKASNKHDGILTMQDFADYSVDWSKPVQCQYEGYTIQSAPPPSSGGTTICQILKIAEPWPLSDWGYGSVKTVQHLAEAERRAFADRNTYLGDPAYVDNPIDQLLDDAHIDAMRSTITDGKATPSAEIEGSLGPPEGNNTTHYSVVDNDGNAVAVTYTINYLFGTGRIAGDTGFFLNNEMDDFTSKPGVPNSFGLVQGEINKIEPGKRPLSSMSPTIVMNNDDLFMVTGSPGGSTIISTTMQSILNVIDFDMNVQQAVNAPRMHQQWYPEKIYIEPGLLTDDAQQTLKGMGYSFKHVDSWGADEAIVVDPETGNLKGANDRRRPAGSAAGF